jgi:osmoprotectant transport system substrate-binding protein
MMVSRARALTLLGSVPFLSCCGNRAAVRVGCKQFSENIMLAEIYAAALERAEVQVERHMAVDAEHEGYAAISRGEIQVYPEYLGTALVNVLGDELPLRITDPGLIAAELRRRYAAVGLTWLDYSRASDSQGLAVTRSVATRLGIRNLSDCARMATSLGLFAPREFGQREDGLVGLRRFYPGGFEFKERHWVSIGEQYETLAESTKDAVALIFTSSPLLVKYDLVVLTDDRHFWPPYNIAPVVRIDTLRTHPDIRAALNNGSSKLTQKVLLKLNAYVDLHGCDPAVAARALFSSESNEAFSCQDLVS